MFCGDSSPADGFLPEHPENVICQHCKFQYQSIGFKFAVWQPFQIHICFYFTMELLAFSLGMVKSNDLRVCQPKVCPLGIYLNVIWEQELSLFINGSVYDFITCADGNVFFFPGLCFVGYRFPVTPDIDGFSVTGCCNIPAAGFCHE